MFAAACKTLVSSLSESRDLIRFAVLRISNNEGTDIFDKGEKLRMVLREHGSIVLALDTP